MSIAESLNNLDDLELYQRKTGNSEKWKDLNEYFWNKKTKEFLGYNLIGWGEELSV